MIESLTGSLQGKPIQKLTYHELLRLTCDTRPILLDKTCIAGELELFGAVRGIVSLPGVMQAFIFRIFVIFAHLQQVADSGYLLADEVVHSVLLVIAGESLYLANHTSVAAAGLTCHRSLLLQVFEQLAELAEVARPGLPVGDHRCLLMELGDHSINRGASLADQLVFDQLGTFALGHLLAML